MIHISSERLSHWWILMFCTMQKINDNIQVEVAFIILSCDLLWRDSRSTVKGRWCLKLFLLVGYHEFVLTALWPRRRTSRSVYRLCGQPKNRCSCMKVSSTLVIGCMVATFETWFFDAFPPTLSSLTPFDFHLFQCLKNSWWELKDAVHSFKDCIACGSFQKCKQKYELGEVAAEGQYF